MPSWGRHDGLCDRARRAERDEGRRRLEGLRRQRRDGAGVLDYSGVPVRVVRPEYLVALYLEPQARTAKRRERAAALCEDPAFDHQRLQEIMMRFHLTW